MAKPETPFACNLKALNAEERKRYDALVHRLLASVAEVSELPNGYGLRMSPQGVSIAELAEWVMLERKCCPFFDFEIQAAREGGPVWLRLGGRDGVKQFIQSEFRLVGGKSPGGR